MIACFIATLLSNFLSTFLFRASNHLMAFYWIERKQKMFSETQKHPLCLPSRNGELGTQSPQGKSLI